MKLLMRCVLICLIASASYLYAETVFAASNVFSFPAMTGVKTQQAKPQPATFALNGIDRFSRTMTFSWSFPSKTFDKQGVITVYSLLGRVVARIPIQKASGSTQWNFSHSLSNNGLYIARISYGTVNKNLKLMLWN